MLALSLRHDLCVPKTRTGDLTKDSASMFARSRAHPESLLRLGISQRLEQYVCWAGVSTGVLNRARDLTNIQQSQVKD